MGFFDQWMANIKEQGFTLYKAYGEDAEYTKEEEHTEEMGYTVISADNLKQMNRFDGEDMENERQMERRKAVAGTAEGQTNALYGRTDAADL